LASADRSDVLVPVGVKEYKGVSVLQTAGVVGGRRRILNCEVDDGENPMTFELSHDNSNTLTNIAEVY